MEKSYSHSVNFNSKLILTIIYYCFLIWTYERIRKTYSCCIYQPYKCTNICSSNVKCDHDFSYRTFCHCSIALSIFHYMNEILCALMTFVYSLLFFHCVLGSHYIYVINKWRFSSHCLCHFGKWMVFGFFSSWWWFKVFFLVSSIWYGIVFNQYRFSSLHEFFCCFNGNENMFEFTFTRTRKKHLEKKKHKIFSHLLFSCPIHRMRQIQNGN